MPQNKTYLSNLDKERKRLTKIELSSIDALKESFNQVEAQILSVDAALELVEKSGKFLSQSITDTQDLADKIVIALRDLKADLKEHEDFSESLEDVTTKLRDLYETKTEDVVNDFDKNADALGIKAGQIPERNLLVESNIEAQKITDKAFRQLNDDKSSIAEAEKLINEYK